MSTERHPRPRLAALPLALLTAASLAILAAPAAAQTVHQPEQVTVNARPVPPAGPDLPAPPRHLVEPDHKREGLAPTPPGTPNDLRAVPVPITLSTHEPLAGGAEAKADFIEVSVVGAGSLSTVGEPSASMADDQNGFFSGNWHAARTQDGGATWTGVNPGTRFGAGFCCDQRVITHSSGVSIWLLQYSSTNGDYHKLAVADTPADLGAGNFARSFDVSATSFGLTGDLDYPDVAVAGDFFYFASNVFNPSNAVVYRIRAADFLTGTIGLSFFRSSNPAGGGLGGASYRFTQTAIPTGRMYFAEHRTTSRMAIFEWTDAGALTTHERDVPLWSDSSYVDTCPDGVDWLSRADSRLTGAYQTANEIGFLWCSSAVGTITRPHVRIARFSKTGIERIAVNTVRFSDTSVAYPAAGPNVAGHIGIALAMGGGTRYPSFATALVDDIQNFERGITVTIERGGDDTPTPAANGTARFGDYLTVVKAPHDDDMTFIATGLSQRGGPNGSNSEPRFLHWGRSAFQPVFFTGLIVRSQPAGVSIQVSAPDIFLQADDVTPFYRKYLAHFTNVSVTAPASYFDASNREWRFVRWASKAVPDENFSPVMQPLGNRTYTIADLQAATDIVEAIYERTETARTSSYGAACPAPGLFYQRFDASTPFDLANRGFTLHPDGSGGYRVIVDSNPSFDGAVSSNLGLGDDQLAQAQPLGFTVTVPGAGSVSSVDVDSNGRVGFGLTSSDFSESVDELRAQKMIAALWDDLNPALAAPGDGVFLDRKPAYTMITWLRVPEFSSSNLVNAQIRIRPSGQIDVVYAAVAINDCIAGFSAGTNLPDPGPRDLSSSAPFAVGAGHPGLALGVSAPPLLGTTILFQVTQLPGSTIFGVVNLGLSQTSLALDVLGAPGCSSLVGTVVVSLAFSSPLAQSLPFAVPNVPAFVGGSLFSQALAITPGVNAFGLVASNGIELVLGNR
ncbi:MAG: hypothetical protein HZB39_06050 [Planctomycetes bacterium]|nr:hypothetical protein [Planctomycetota bacterium]